MTKQSISRALRAILAVALLSSAGEGLVAVSSPLSAHAQQAAPDGASAIRSVAPGVKEKITGIIARENKGRLVLMESGGQEVLVNITSSTKIEEKKSNPFRGARHYTQNQLVRGLNIEVEGRGGASGAVYADRIRLKDDDLAVAQTVESRVSPVEGRLGKAETRLTESEENASRLSGQIDELNTISNAARGGAKAAQETADAALDGVDAANERISALDEYQMSQSITVNFRAGSAILSDEAKESLDQIAQQVQGEKGYAIQVAGFASTDGNEAFNRKLSQKRAEAVVQYLVMEHDVPLRRIITPFGYGEVRPVADNSTREGREQNRRVEVSVLVSRGITGPASMRRRDSSNAGSGTHDGQSAIRQDSSANRNH